MYVEAPKDAFQILEFASSLSKARSITQDEVGEIVAGDLIGKRKTSRLPERVHKVIGYSDGFSSHMNLMPAPLDGHIFSDRIVASIEYAQVICTEAEVTACIQAHFGRSWGGNLNARVRKSKRSA